MNLTRRWRPAALVMVILGLTGVFGLQSALAISFSGLNVTLDCTSFNYALYSLTTNRNNTGGPPGGEAEAYDIIVTDGAGTVIHQSGNTLPFNTYFDGPATPAYNLGAPQYNPITFTWISQSGNGLLPETAYTVTGNCAGLPTYQPPASPSTATTDVEPQFDPGDDRLNRANKDRAAPVAIFCMDWGIEVRVIHYASSRGIDPPAITALYEDIDALGIPASNILLGEGSGVTLHRLTTGEFAVHTLYPNEYKWYIFVWDQCPVPTNVYHASV